MLSINAGGDVPLHHHIAADMKRTPNGSLNVMADSFTDASALRVLVVSPVRLLREGIARVLRAHGLRNVTLASEEAVLADLSDGVADVAILDVTRASMFPIMRELAERHAHLRLLALGVGQSDAEVLACAQAGAAGYLPLDGGPDELIAAIHCIHRDELVCSPHVAALLFRGQAARAPQRPDVESPHLTRREQEILAFVDRGLGNKEIAARLSISLTTVKNHVHHILEKLHVRCRGAAAARVRGIPTPHNHSAFSR